MIFQNYNIKLTETGVSSPMSHRTPVYNRADRGDDLGNLAKIRTYWAQAGTRPNAADAGWH